jgi:hypothetical protein
LFFIKDIIRRFLHQWPGSVEETNHRGSLPLHNAAGLRVRATPDGIRLRSSAAPSLCRWPGATTKGRSRFTRASPATTTCFSCPSPEGAFHKSSLDAVSVLVEQAPEALQVADYRDVSLQLNESVCDPGDAFDPQFLNTKRLVIWNLVKALPRRWK